MIYYFSGTGNSKFVASSLGKLLNQEIKFIPEVEVEEENPDENGYGLIFPVYSWGIPPIVKEFVDNFSEGFWERLNVLQSKVWCIAVCGDEIGLTADMLIKLFKGKTKIESIWSVIMPNNYVLLPGFDVDPKQLENEKLAAIPNRLLKIADGIMSGIKTIDVIVGKFPYIKSKLIYPLFVKWGIFPSKWHYTESCIGCGKCAKICPLLNIKLNENRHPQWNNHCCSCLACYHICPVHAVEYGKETTKKGQYFFPKL